MVRPGNITAAVGLWGSCSVYVLAQSFNTHIEVADLIKAVKPCLATGSAVVMRLNKKA